MKPPVKDLILKKHPEGDVTQWFGENPALYQRFGMLYHNGIDIVRPHGTPMYAIEKGKVASVKTDPSGFGKHVRIISDKAYDGVHREWTYGHCSKIHVEVNDKVNAGDHIADMGNTGFTVSSSNANGFWKVNPYAGTHLHLGLRNVKLNVKGGWRYKDSNLPFMEVMDYQNGVRGAIDPVPVLSKLAETESTELTHGQKQQLLRRALIEIVKRLQRKVK